MWMRLKSSLAPKGKTWNQPLMHSRGVFLGFSSCWERERKWVAMSVNVMMVQKLSIVSYMIASIYRLANSETLGRSNRFSGLL